MEELEISNYNKESIESILDKKNVKYSVSFFQRDYSWGRDEWTKFLDDIIDSFREKRKHFLGFMTFFKQKDTHEFQIVEGQQRLATITILVAVIRDFFFEKDDDKWKEIDSQLIKTKDIFSDKSYLKLELSDMNKDFFKEHIQKEGIPKEKIDKMMKEKRKLKSSNRLIMECYNYFYEKLKHERFLLELLRQSTREFIVVTTEVTNLRSAYILFQTLNDRGLDLTLSDLLKTHLLQKADDESIEIKKEWDYILNLSGINNMNVFLRHYWLSTKGVIKEEELFDKFSSEISNKEQAFNFIKDLKKEAEVYSSLLDPSPDDFDGDKVIVDLLKNELYILSKQQILPLLLSIHQKFDRKEAKLVMRPIISFIFRYLTIGEQENKELEQLFSNLAIDIRENKINNAETIIKELNRKDIKDETFKELFKNKQMKENKKVVYILTKIEQSLSGQEEKFAADITLEHILPINPDDDCKKYLEESNLLDEKDELIYRIGNMTLLLGKINKKAQNKAPLVKSKEIYSKDTKLKINEDLKRIIKWDEKEIEKRQEIFADCALKVWKI